MAQTATATPPTLSHSNPVSDPTTKMHHTPAPPPTTTTTSMPTTSSSTTPPPYADSSMAAAAAPRPLFRYVPPLPNVEYDRMNIYDAWGYAGYVDIPRSDSFDRRHYVLWTMGLYQANLSEPVLRRCFWPNYQ